jgi:membrane protease YdiL (CAAX protease family)
VPWVVRGAVVQGLVFVPTVLLLLFGVGRRSRRELRLAWGNSTASASPDPYTLWRRPRWRQLGPLWAVLISVGTLTAMFFAVPPEAGMLTRLLPVLPIVLLLAATNTFNEEFQFRNVPLVTLPALFGKAQALLMTAVYFGLEHYYGNPPALSGVLLATFLGYLLGKSMLETGGSRWAWLIHWLQDIIIFSFLVMSWGS